MTIVLYLLAAIVGYVILWAVIRSAVVSAMLRHDVLARRAPMRSAEPESAPPTAWWQQPKP